MQKISIGFSPCPNDTFIFDALVNGKIDTEELQFEAVLEDVETLNRWAAAGKLMVTKLSLPALFKNKHQYQILNSGAALGRGVGPLLIAKKEIPLSEVETQTIAIPGFNTTANFLLSFAFPNATQKTEVVFSEIEDSVLQGNTDLGVLIHENRFTYAAKGLVKLMDLGAYWEEKTGAPIPLGCIAAQRDIPLSTAQKIDRLIRQSLAYAFAEKHQLSHYVRQHAQAMSETVMRQHIQLYVNEFSLALGDEGKRAIKLMQSFCEKGLTVNETIGEQLFLEA